MGFRGDMRIRGDMRRGYMGPAANARVSPWNTGEKEREETHIRTWLSRSVLEETCHLLFSEFDSFLLLTSVMKKIMCSRNRIIHAGLLHKLNP